MVHVVNVEVQEPFGLLLEFNTGERKLVDIEHFLRGPIFRPVRDDPDYFRLVEVDDELGTIVWPNGADIDPDVLYGSHVPAWMEAELALDTALEIDRIVVAQADDGDAWEEPIRVQRSGQTFFVIPTMKDW